MNYCLPYYITRENVICKQKNSHFHFAIHVAIHTAYWYVKIIHSVFIMKKVRVFSNSNKVELTLSTWELLFIVTSLIKVIRLDKENIKFNYRVYKIIDKISLTLHNI